MKTSKRRTRRLGACLATLTLVVAACGDDDEATGTEIMDLLFAMRAERGSTLVIVTHDPALTRRCDRVIRMHSGVVEETPLRSDAKASRA